MFQPSLIGFYAGKPFRLLLPVALWSQFLIGCVIGAAGAAVADAGVVQDVDHVSPVVPNEQASDARGVRTEDVRVEAPDGVSLAGTLYLPDDPGPHPAVVVIHGSEPGRRTNRGYVQWATMVSERGFACLISDKRGVDDSEGEYVEAPDLVAAAGDALAWVNLLKKHDDVRKDAVGVLGWSQGGWIGPIAASQDSDIAFVAAISGPGVSPLEQNIYDKSNQVRAAGVTDEQARRAESTIRFVMTYMNTGSNRDEAEAAWEELREQSWFRDNYRGVPFVDRDAFLADPRGASFLVHNSYEPGPVLESIRVPMLAVFGGADPIVPVQRSIKAMRAAFKRSGSSNLLSVKVFDGANHGIRVRAAEGPSAFPDGYPDYVFDWMDKVVRK